MTVETIQPGDGAFGALIPTHVSPPAIRQDPTPWEQGSEAVNSIVYSRGTQLLFVF